MDSQSVKTTGVGGEERGYDGAKKVMVRKRHLLVDTQGLVLKAIVHPAYVMDRDGIKPLLERMRDLFERLSNLWLDIGYNGAWRWQVCWLAWFAFEGTSTSAAMRTQATQRANNILNNNFDTNPGFNV